MGLTPSGSAGNLTTNLYDRLLQEGKIKDRVAPTVRPSGRSTTVPQADSVSRNLQSEIYFKAPATPSNERRFRRLSHLPGEMHVHHGLKDQKLAGDEFRYGVRTIKGVSTEDSMKAGQLVGVAEYKNSCKEQIYDSLKREPLGKPYNRGHELQMHPDGFGVKSGEPVNSKKIIYPTDNPHPDEASRIQYRKTHNNYHPGERIERNYTWPEATNEMGFRYGAMSANAVEGAGAKLALSHDVEDDGTHKRTRLVQKVVEDYRNVQHPKHFKKAHAKQGAEGPHLGHEHRYGVKSSVSEYNAASCVRGYYSLEEQLPDQDLGRCTKPGRRNVTAEERAFGCPSVRTDVVAPHPTRRSVADEMSYGDEPGAAAILAPQRFDNKGIPDREFLVRRPREELEQLMANAPVDNVDFDSLWEESLGLFDDGLPLVSLDAILYLQSQRIEHHTGIQHGGLHLMTGAR